MPRLELFPGHACPGWNSSLACMPRLELCPGLNAPVGTLPWAEFQLSQSSSWAEFQPGQSSSQGIVPTRAGFHQGQGSNKRGRDPTWAKFQPGQSSNQGRVPIEAGFLLGTMCPRLELCPQLELCPRLELSSWMELCPGWNYALVGTLPRLELWPG